MVLRKNKQNLFFLGARSGQVEILQWLKDFGYKFEYSHNAIDNASKNGPKRALRKNINQRLIFFQKTY